MSLSRSGENRSTDSTSHRCVSRFYRPLCVMVCLGLFLDVVAQMAGGQSLTPPPRPDVPPVISGAYPSDLDGNRIDDELEGRIELSTGPSSLYQAGKSLGVELASERLVDVELVFDEPVTQEQIDAFLAIGGQIRYLYQAVSYGWNGRIALGRVETLPAVMGPTLVLVTPAARPVQLYMDLASQLGRVRPLWQPGFAGHVAGFRGDSNTTIGFIDTGIDSAHADLSGRCVFWDDVSGEPEPDPVDYYGHGSCVAGVAVGTGHSAGADRSELRYTYVEDWPSWAHLVDPISLPAGSVTVTSWAWWSGAIAWLDHVSWQRGNAEMQDLEWIGSGREGYSGISLTNTFYATAQKMYSPVLANYNDSVLDAVVVTTSVTAYPGLADGFNKFSGVAPGCNYAAIKIATRAGTVSDDGFAMGIDRMVVHRVARKIKVVNISGGLTDDWGYPIESVSLRDKVMSAVRSGVIVVAAAGNSANESIELLRQMADPARAALAITVGASNDENRLADYSEYGFLSPRQYASEDFKPDLIAPGGDFYYTTIMSIDSGTCDGLNNLDKVPDDYSSGTGTSFSSPFVAGCAALVIEALERTGIEWDFTSDRHPRLVKMLLCATATETNAARQGGDRNPTLERDADGPDGFAVGKDRYEGYGLINADAAIEAVGSAYAPGSSVSVELGGGVAGRRAWASTVSLTAGCGIDVSLSNPAGADFDLYLYSMTPSSTGTPVILASSTTDQAGATESISYTPQTDTTALLVVKRVSGMGTFQLESVQAGPPIAQNGAISTGVGSAVTVTLVAVDDGSPNPPGQLTYTIMSLPQHGRLERLGGSPITTAPAMLTQGVNQVIYRPNETWLGDDSFTFRADDGGVAPFGGHSNVAMVCISVVSQMTSVYKVGAGDDDAYGSQWSAYQDLSDRALALGEFMPAMRFCGLDIPQGASILSATLRICAHPGGLTGRVTARLRAEAADNPGPFSSSRRINALTLTQAAQDWSWDSTPWVAHGWYDSPDISSLIQEVVDRPGWAPGNALVIAYVAQDFSGIDRLFWAYEGDPAKAVELVIVYQP